MEQCQKLYYFSYSTGASLLAQTVKNPPAMREIWVRFLGQEDPLEKRMATHSSILVWRIPQTEKPGRLQPMGPQKVRHNWVTNFHLHISYKYKTWWNMNVTIFKFKNSIILFCVSINKHASVDSYPTFSCDSKLTTIIWILRSLTFRYF